VDTDAKLNIAAWRRSRPEWQPTISNQRPTAAALLAAVCKASMSARSSAVLS
jgi:hypothetical protein